MKVTGINQIPKCQSICKACTRFYIRYFSPSQGNLYWFVLFFIFTTISVAFAQMSPEDKKNAKVPNSTKQIADPKQNGPGPRGDYYLLPNGWKLTPAGKQIGLAALPLNIIPLAKSNQVIVTTDGFNEHRLSLIDLDQQKIISSVEVNQSWFGLQTDEKQERFWWSGGGGNRLHQIEKKGDQLTRLSPLDPNHLKMPREEINALKGFRSGLKFDSSKNILYSLNIQDAELLEIKSDSMEILRTVKLVGKPYDLQLSPNRARLYISDWAGRQVLVVDPSNLKIVKKIPVGEHPNQIVVDRTGKRLWVACASSDEVVSIDLGSEIVTERIKTSLFAHSLPGSTPNALAITPDNKTLFAANAETNQVVVIDISKKNSSQVIGFIPTGWYPCSLAVTSDQKYLLIGNGLGSGSHANPTTEDKHGYWRKKPGNRGLPFPYIGTTMKGSLQIVPLPEEKDREKILGEYTNLVYKNSPDSQKMIDSLKRSEHHPIPIRLGGHSPIEYVLYIIKENRTYDQILGDMPEGNGDKSLCMFPEKVTPNHHQLAREFVLFDNLYCNGHVSRSGHPWSTAAYNTDYIGKDWHLSYSNRRGIDDDDEGDLLNSPAGYLWDACARAKITYRSYGEFGKRNSTSESIESIRKRLPGLIDHFNLEYSQPPKKGQLIRDTDRIKIFLKEFHEFESKGTVPRFMIMGLPEDHTFGTTTGRPTPESCVASNDLALGQLVDELSRSKIWPKLAIFVIEDDAQNGPDHVDTHRTVGLLISPYTRRKYVDHTPYTTMSYLRTMELILGLSPLTQFDAAANPMVAAFVEKPDLTPYTHMKNQIDLNIFNKKSAYGADRSNRMDFSGVDLVDDFELNEILWRNWKGANSAVPPIVQRAIAIRTQPELNTPKK